MTADGTASAALAPGTRFGGYRIVRLLGEGGMGAVHEGMHDGLQKRVAIKTLHPSVVTSAEAVERFVREGRTASRIRHPNVVDVTDVGVENGTPYLVMEYLDGVSLASYVARHGPLPLEVLLDVALPVIDALAAAHDEGVVHRDIKPDNVFLVQTRSGELAPKLLDFGISKVDGGSVDARLTKTSAMMGTPYYMSPEQARGAKHVDARSDQFSFGLVLHEMASGKRPIDGDSLLEVIHRISTVDVPPLARVRPDLPTELIAVVSRALSLDPARRFVTMRELGAGLLPFAGPRARAVWERAFAPSQTRASGVTPSQTRVSGVTDPGVITPTIAPPRRNRGTVIVLGVGLAGLAILGIAGIVVLAFVTSWTGGHPTSVPPTRPVVVSAPPPVAAVLPAPSPIALPTPPPPPAPPAPTHPSAAGHTRRGGATPTAPGGSGVPRDFAAPPPPVGQLAVPSRSDVTTAMQSVSGQVAQCFGGEHGMVRVTVVVSGANGRVVAVTVGRQWAGTPVELCVGSALQRARFPRFSSETFTFTFPFRI